MLGADRSISDEALRQHYRRLVAENHPDREIARGLPQEAVAIATRRLAAINAAWDLIADERRAASHEPLARPDSPVAANVFPSPNHGERERRPACPTC